MSAESLARSRADRAARAATAAQIAQAATAPLYVGALNAGGIVAIPEPPPVPQLPASAGNTAAAPHVWQPYPSPWLGGGDVPADQGLKLRIRPGDVYGTLGAPPVTNRNVEIAVPPNCTDGYYVWIVATLDAKGNLTDCAYDWGTARPELSTVLPDSGNLPTETYYTLFFVTSNATAIVDYSNCYAATNLSLNVVNGTVYWSPPAPYTAVTTN